MARTGSTEEHQNMTMEGEAATPRIRVRGLRKSFGAQAVLDGIAAWSAGVLATIPQLRDALDAAVADIAARAGDDFGRVASTHPAASWLQRRRAGKLSPDRLGCATPDDVARLGAAIGVAVPAGPF